MSRAALYCWYTKQQQTAQINLTPKNESNFATPFWRLGQVVTLIFGRWSIPVSTGHRISCASCGSSQCDRTTDSIGCLILVGLEIQQLLNFITLSNIRHIAVWLYWKQKLNESSLVPNEWKYKWFIPVLQLSKIVLPLLLQTRVSNGEDQRITNRKGFGRKWPWPNRGYSRTFWG